MADTITLATLSSLEGSLRRFIARRVREAEVDDVLQDVFVRLMRAVGDLQDEQRLEAWGYRVARSAIIDQYRARDRHVYVDDAAGVEQPAEDGQGESQVERELAACVGPFVAALPEPYREALRLTDLQGLTQKEAAERLGVSLSGVKSRVQRGRAKLREAFDGCCHIALDARGQVLDYVPRRPTKCGECRE